MATALEYLPNSRHFNPSEWSDAGILEYVDSKVLVGMDTLREGSGIALHPSRLSDGWARFTGSKTSRHYAEGRLSDAADFFPASNVLDCWLAAMENPLWGGFGLYLDTRRSKFQPGPMMHLDCRPGKRIFWVRDYKGKMVFLHKNSAQFWALIDKVRRA